MDCRSALTKLGFAALTGGSALAIYSARGGGDAGSAALVLALAAAAALLLFVCLRGFVAMAGIRCGMIKAMVMWALPTTALTAMFASPPQPAGDGGHIMRRQSAALALLAFGAVACDSALAIHDVRRDAGSSALVFAAYAALVALVGFFLREFDGGRVATVGMQGQQAGQGRGLGADDEATHGDILVDGDTAAAA